MLSVLLSLLAAAPRTMRTRAALQLEILALRHQLNVLERSVLAVSGSLDRLLWA